MKILNEDPRYILTLALSGEVVVSDSISPRTLALKSLKFCSGARWAWTTALRLVNQSGGVDGAEDN